MKYPAIIAMDGPVASGKSTIGKELAKRLDYTFVDTGILYRAVTLAALDRGVSVDDEPALAELAAKLHLQMTRGGEGVVVDGVDWTTRLRAAEVDAAVSSVAKVAGVRHALLDHQRAIAEGGRVVMVGRDIGTKVLPSAAKVYLDASVEERTRRRVSELEQKGEPRSQAEVRANLEFRDANDSQRAEAPLVVAQDAHVVFTEGLDAAGVVDCVMRLLQRPENQP